MSISNAFITSIGVGFCIHPSHSPNIPLPMVGVVILGSPNKTSSNLAAARVGDLVIGFCGHLGVLVMGSSDVQSTYIQQSLIGSPFVGYFNGVIVHGSAPCFSGE